MSEIVIKTDSIYWLEQIRLTEVKLSELYSSDILYTKSAKTDEDSLEFQDISTLIDSAKKYLAYCKQRYNEELQKETGVTPNSAKSILYFNTPYGY